MRAPAPLVHRLLAYLLDVAIVFPIFVAIQLILAPIVEGFVGTAWRASGPLLELYTILTVSLPVWLYFALFDSSRRRGTWGKRIFRLRVGRIDGGPVSPPRAFLRTVIKLLPWEVAHLTINLPRNPFIDPETGAFMGWDQAAEFRWGFFVVYALIAVYVASCLLNRERRSVHDFATKTLVTREDARSKPPLP